MALSTRLRFHLKTLPSTLKNRSRNLSFSCGHLKTDLFESHDVTRSNALCVDGDIKRKTEKNMRFAIKKNTYGRGLYFHNISYSKTRESLEENLNIDQSLGISAAFYILLNFNRVTIIL